MENPIQRNKPKRIINTAEVEIRGLKSLLMSSPKEMYLDAIESPMVYSKLKTKKTDPKSEAEKRAYRNKDHGWTGDLCVPAKCIQRCLEEAAKKFKTKRGTASTSQAVKGSVTVEPEFIPILDGEGINQVFDYEVNADKVKISATKGSVIRYRPEIKEWTLKFRIQWMPELYQLNESALQNLVERAGYEGLLDYRPKYGIFEVVKFVVLE
jgi:hypothetical protein